MAIYPFTVGTLPWTGGTVVVGLTVITSVLIHESLDRGPQGRTTSRPTLKR